MKKSQESWLQATNSILRNTDNTDSFLRPRQFGIYVRLNDSRMVFYVKSFVEAKFIFKTPAGGGTVTHPHRHTHTPTYSSCSHF